ncbi:MAG: CvpA family protein [Limisphaerales bacterium]
MVFIVGMTIWILALILMASSIALGHKQGAIRASFSFIGIVLAALLAAPIGHLLKPLFPHVGIHNPISIWIFAPIIAFIIILTLVKMGGFFVHRKVNVYYKYHAGDLRLSLWERLNARLGLCVGVLNGAAYLVLVCFVIYNLSYWTVQVATSDDQPRTVKLVNRLGEDLQSTGMDKPAHAVAPLPNDFYKIANLAGLICQNPQLGDRLGRYPAFLSLFERDDLQQLAQSADFTNALRSRASVGQVLNQPQVKSVLKNNDLIQTIWTTVKTNADDLMAYLKTGKSEKFDSEKILGRWDFNVGISVAMLMQERPNIPSREMGAIRALWNRAYAQTTFIAGTDHQSFLKNVPNFAVKAGQPPTVETWKGQWSNAGTNYALALSSNGQNKTMTAKTDGQRLTLKDKESTMVFDREE